MDEIDRKILEFLKEDSRQSFGEMGKKVRLAEASVRRRVKKMVEEGTIKRFTVEIGVEQGTSAMSLISVSPSTSTPEVAERLKKVKGVEVVYEITGQYDVAAIVIGPNIAEINRGIDEIRKIPGVATTNSIIILRVLR